MSTTLFNGDSPIDLSLFCNQAGESPTLILSIHTPMNLGQSLESSTLIVTFCVLKFT